MDEFNFKHSQDNMPESDEIMVEVDSAELSPASGESVKAIKRFNSTKIFYYCLGGIALILLVVLGFFLYDTYFSKGDTFNEYKNPNYVEVEDDEIPLNPIDFEKIWEVNPDVCAWIQVEGLEVIDYPILQSSPEADDNYYLDHDINGDVKRAGSIYIQKLNKSDFSDRNTLIYGHNMLNGSMFGRLKKFRNSEFFNQNRNIYIYTPDQIMQYEIVSCFIYDDRHILNSFNFSIENECQEFFDQCLNPSSRTKQVFEDATLTTSDKIITLSTCTSNDSERELLVAKLVNITKTQGVSKPE